MLVIVSENARWTNLTHVMQLGHRGRRVGRSSKLGQSEHSFALFFDLVRLSKYLIKPNANQYKRRL